MTPTAARMLLALLALMSWSHACPAAEEPLARVRVSEDGKDFVVGPEAKRFVVWGLNYDHDGSGRLLEDYWDKEWEAIEGDFAEMRQLGANVVRVHLQFGRFMKSPSEPNPAALKQLGRLLELAQRKRLYLDITGLGCYHKQDVPPWYDRLDEKKRWDAQAAFWDAVAGTCAGNTAVFCYDLMNEPVVQGGDKPGTDWLGPGFGGKHFVQRITLDRAGRPRPEIAKAWIDRLSAAVRRRDPQALVTVGMVPWSLDRPGLTSGFVPDKVADALDFIAVHVYPEKAKVDAAVETLRGFAIGKPLVVEETFPLKCSAEELGEFFDKSRGLADGWVGFYWGQTREECRKSGTLGGAITATWLELFEKPAAGR